MFLSTTVLPNLKVKDSIVHIKIFYDFLFVLIGPGKIENMAIEIGPIGYYLASDPHINMK